MNETAIMTMILILVYIFPSVSAIGRNVKHREGIVILNLLLGWTVLGWIGSLIWAVSSPIKSNEETNTTTQGENV